ncbi:MAG: hypothetical protein J7M21_00120, partial [Planctomycetes bacterium]|nr:hypothetical protein [Planctomycetota bacterium]
EPESRPPKPDAAPDETSVRPAGEASDPPGPPAALKVVLYEGPGAAAMDATRRTQLAAALLDAGYAVTRPPAGGDVTAGADVPADGLAVAYVGHFAGGETPESLRRAGTTCIDVTDKCPCGSLAAVDEARRAMGIAEPDGWIPWFPVIDYDRCVACKQCHNFCLFGVFEVDGGGRVRVVRPANCKTNCPACARTCPQGAIIFPRHHDGPINGDEVDEEELRRRRAGDIEARLRGDVYQVLRSRSAGRSPAAACGCRVPARPTPADLARLAKQLGIPAEAVEAIQAHAGCACQADSPGDSCGCGGAAADGEPAPPGCDCRNDPAAPQSDRRCGPGGKDAAGA